MSDEVELSGMARRVLEKMRAYPDNYWYDLKQLGGVFRPNDLVRLDRAYSELERDGLVRPSGEDYSFFGHTKTLYRLTQKGLVSPMEPAR